jgi:hypothetical protein
MPEYFATVVKRQEPVPDEHPSELVSTLDTRRNGAERQLLAVWNVLDNHVNLTSDPRPHTSVCTVASSRC